MSNTKKLKPRKSKSKENSWSNNYKLDKNIAGGYVELFI
jgi:hypothetical protein